MRPREDIWTTRPLTVGEVEKRLAADNREAEHNGNRGDQEMGAGMSVAICAIPNCGKQAPAHEAFCSDHRDNAGAAMTEAQARELLAKAADELGYDTDARVLRTKQPAFIQVNAAVRAIILAREARQ